MPLAGTFDVLDFADVLDMLARGGHTGRLQVRAGPVHATILLTNGAMVGADGSAGSGGGHRSVRSLVDDICFEVLRAGRGSFEFHPDAEVPSSGATIKVGTAIAAAKRRLAEWRDVETVIPSFDATPRLAGHLGIDTVTLNQEQWRVLVALDGRRSIAALARRLDVDPLEICKVLKPLVQGGAVVLDDVEAKIKALPVVSIPTLPKPEDESLLGEVRVIGASPALTVPVADLDSPPDDEAVPAGAEANGAASTRVIGGRGRSRLVQLRRHDRVAPTG